MAKTIEITGASDDLIEVTGDIHAEFSPSEKGAAEGVIVAVSTGTLLRVRYDEDGIWRVVVARNGADVIISKIEGNVELDTFDRVTLSAERIEWVAIASDFVTA